MTRSVLVLVLLVGCGGAGARDARTLRLELSPAMDASRERAAPLVASVEQALMDAEAAEAALDVTGAAEHRTRARLLSALVLGDRRRHRQHGDEHAATHQKRVSGLTE